VCRSIGVSPRQAPGTGADLQHVLLVEIREMEQRPNLALLGIDADQHGAPQRGYVRRLAGIQSHIACSCSRFLQ
jgi:hypothetical protein